MSALGVVIALRGVSADWPDELWAKSVGLFDTIIRTCYGVYEFTDDPDCVLWIGLSAARAPVSLSDGTRIEIGELVGTLHFWNEHLPSYMPDGPVLGCACAMRGRVIASLRWLADYVECEPARRHIRAFRSEAALPTRLGTSQVQRVAERFGFERVPTDTSFLRRPSCLRREFHAVGSDAGVQSCSAVSPAIPSRSP